MRWIRFLITLVSASFRTSLRICDESTLNFRVWLTDIDISIMNHAAMMTVMEMGRIDFMRRTGFLKLAAKNKWYFPTASINVQFFKPMKAFQKAQLITKVLHIEEKWIYMEQKIIRGNKQVAICVSRNTVKKNREHVSVPEILKQLQIGEAPQAPAQLIESFDHQDLMIKDRLF